MEITPEDNMNAEKHLEHMREAAKGGYGSQSHGFIYEVIQDFSAKCNAPIFLKDGVVLKEKYETADERVYRHKHIKKGSFIEFRYAYNFHFRDEENNYYEIDPSIAAIKCVPYAKIDEAIRWNNQLKLREILANKLYEKVV